MSSPYREVQRPAAPKATVTVRWLPREPPLVPACVIALDDVARALGRRMQRMDDATLSALRGVAGRGCLALLGDATTLPWVDGVTYLGRVAEAPSLLVPTVLRPDVTLALFERALMREAPCAAPMAILPRATGLVALSLAEALPISRARLAAWLAR